MTLIRLILRYRPLATTLVLLLSLGSALLSVGVIAFINWRLVTVQTAPTEALLQFLGLLLLLLAMAAGAQVALTALGHRFVYDLRRQVVKRVLDTDIERIEAVGGPAILASLSSDLRNLTLAFVQLPGLLYGAVLSLAAFLYMAWLSWSLFLVTLAWMTLTLGLGWLLVTRLNRHLHLLRDAENSLYADYQALIEGRKELALNRARAQRFFEEDFEDNASAYREHVTLADRYNALASNWANTMVLGTIGLAFYLANGLGWASTEVAATYALTILFLRTPLVMAVGALPPLMAGQVALERVEALALAPAAEDFAKSVPAFAGDWQRLELRGVEYRYETQGDEQGFDVGPLNLTLRRGETVFLMGGNGSGKSTLARLLTGLYQPQRGVIAVDDRVVGVADRTAYRQLFAAVFTDFHLFDRLLGPDGTLAEGSQVQTWLRRLHLERKVRVAEGRLSDTRLSQGQRKRLALLLAMLEGRSIVLLDEWAADQDPLFRQLFYRELLPLMKAAGLTVFAITHDDAYFDQADRLLKMDGGRLVELVGEQRERASRDALREIAG
ncbi:MULTISPECIES: multidrug ABC transporter permease/ATP-binding protein [unclassified Pseudomonas]|uniref:multidrug ABC transporter permease/ATP-binding protein n=1 Tax=unclassified Pseudomonas TaxID=196821 RepID=UPI000798D705|nr:MULTISPECIES: multidrug ABC transporter permease/ATP-binding protein [unclassified Pseudomonas]KXJ31511.1 multidrug transporter membrane component/ATP-binding component [Pseudomonas sp. HUK17]SEP38658.1 putative ATP-binding cassette transporter [Pseudomonas sp. Snoq117.2]